MNPTKVMAQGTESSSPRRHGHGVVRMTYYLPSFGFNILIRPSASLMPIVHLHLPQRIRYPPSGSFSLRISLNLQYVLHVGHFKIMALCLQYSAVSQGTSLLIHAAQDPPLMSRAETPPLARSWYVEPITAPRRVGQEGCSFSAALCDALIWMPRPNECAVRVQLFSGSPCLF